MIALLDDFQIMHCILFLSQQIKHHQGPILSHSDGRDWTLTGTALLEKDV